MCAIHREAGADALPSACRHFPRQILRDRRGTFISLSHFCPTAAAMLLARDPLQLVEAHPPLRLSEPVEGLDATDALPPLVRPGVLTDLEGYGAWEQACVATFARADLSLSGARSISSRRRRKTIRGWRPGTVTPLRTRARRVSRRASRGRRRRRIAQIARAIETVAALCGGRVPEDVIRDYPSTNRAQDIARFEETWQQRVAPAFPRFDVAMKNYLAARVFANWIAYQGRGLRSIVEWLRTCAALVRHQHRPCGRATSGSAPDTADFLEAVRMADLLLLHVVDTQAFAWRFAPLEGPDPR